MTSYYDLKEQAAELLRQAEELRATERNNVLQSVRETVAEWNFTVAELGLRSKGDKRAKLPAKYRDPISGKEWCGRGAMPKWLTEQLQAGASKEQFAL